MFINQLGTPYVTYDYVNKINDTFYTSHTLKMACTFFDTLTPKSDTKVLYTAKNNDKITTYTLMIT